MPELPEVETVCRGLAPHLVGARVKKVMLNRPNLRFDFPDQFAHRLEGQVIKTINRRAKYILIELSGGETWLSHLGMTGNYHIADGEPSIPSGKHDHVVIELIHNERGTCTLIYSDPRRFGFMDVFLQPHNSKYLKDMGPEPLGNQFTAEALAKSLETRRMPIKSALLDQRIIAGLGNIYVCEALWRAGIAPTRHAHTLVQDDGTPSQELVALVGFIRDILDEAIEAGGSTLQDFRNTSGETGYFQHSFDVYGREGEACHREECSNTIERIVQSGRSTFLCPCCQPETG